MLFGNIKTLNNYLIKKNKDYEKIFFGINRFSKFTFFAQQFGVKAGLNLSDISNTSTAVDTKMKTGLYADCNCYFPRLQNLTALNQNWCTNQMGAKQIYMILEELSVKFLQQLKLDYLSLPIMLQYNLPSNLYLEVDQNLVTCFRQTKV